MFVASDTLFIYVCYNIYELTQHDYLLQGRTIRKVILSISEHPHHFLRMTWEHLYVALSRVRLKDDVRLLLRNGDRSTMNYIRELEKNKTVKSFFKGYISIDGSANGSRGVIEGSTLMKWDPQKASEAAGYC